jgi:hypothetical protein
MPTLHQERLRRSVRFFYDLQKLRIQASNRNTTDSVELDKEDLAFMTATGKGLNALERDGLKDISRILKGIPIYTRWLKLQKGIGPTMGGVMVAEIDISKAPTISALWRFCGLAVDNETGRAERLVKGKKATYHPWLKSKVLRVMGEGLIKANSPYRRFYDNYKTRKENTIMAVCMGCDGGGLANIADDDAAPDPKTKKKATKKVKCTNCNGKGGAAPWGSSKAHRHNAALRYMVKMFLADLWTTWRQLEGLPVTEPYAVTVLGRVHGDHGGADVSRVLGEPQMKIASQPHRETQKGTASRSYKVTRTSRASQGEPVTSRGSARPRTKETQTRVASPLLKEAPRRTASPRLEVPQRPVARQPRIETRLKAARRKTNGVSHGTTQ